MSYPIHLHKSRTLLQNMVSDIRGADELHEQIKSCVCDWNYDFFDHAYRYLQV